MTMTNDAQDLQRNGQLEAERIRARLRQVVRECKLTRKAIAKRAGLTLAVLSSVLREGGPGFYVDRVSRILEAIEVDPSEFYGELYFKDFRSTGDLEISNERRSW